MAEEKKTADAPVTKVAPVVKFTVEQILSSDKFKGSRDYLRSALDEKKQYTTDDVYAIVQKFKERKVK